MRRTNTKINMKLQGAFGLALGLLFSLALVSTASAAARLYFIASPSTVNTGDTFTVKVMLDTGGTASNAVSAYFSYPANLAQALNVDTSASSLTLFAENEASGGMVKISGGKPSPGVNGVHEVARVSFKALSTGTASFAFTDESAVVSNSSNEDILGTKTPVSISLVAPAPAPAPTPAPAPAPTPAPAPAPDSNPVSEESESEDLGVEDDIDVLEEELGDTKVYSLGESAVVNIATDSLPDTVYILVDGEKFQLVLDRDVNGALVLFNGKVYPIAYDKVSSFSVGGGEVFGLATESALQLSLNSDVFAGNNSVEAGEAQESRSGLSLFAIFLIVIVVLVIVVLGVVFFVNRKRSEGSLASSPTSSTASNSAAGPTRAVKTNVGRGIGDDVVAPKPVAPAPAPAPAQNAESSTASPADNVATPPAREGSSPAEIPTRSTQSPDSGAANSVETSESDQNIEKVEE